MKILINAISARMGGIVTYTRNLMDSLAERNDTAEFAVSQRFPGADRPNMLRVTASDLRPALRLIWEQTQWRRIVSRRKPDVLFSSANFGLLACPVPQVLLVREGGLFDPFYLANVSPEQGLWSALQRKARRRLIIASARSADQVMTPTAAMRDLLSLWSPDLEQKITVNPYGTMSHSFIPATEAPRQWKADGILRLLYVSVYYPHKRPGLVCQAVEALVARGSQAHATITMTRQELDDFLGSAHDRILIDTAIAAQTVTLGRQPYEALPRLYQNHDIFIFPSISETFGHPMAEAMSSGIPVLAADTPVNREVCGDAALYFDPLSLSSLLACIDRLDNDPNLRAELIDIGRKRVLSCYTWDQHVERLMEILSNTAQRKPG
ncbi:glycosyltransferase family 4 protein [Magnetospirillum sulfuroxidans]|uniref:Glycosyltransferase family 4 protein n=1 Tax=Magnetospirillum sulfuroxidans TaxID=611300 RepID=A0ABS5IH07_9PROT|nr:glycosyltransferase family 1 protein [Magnetospirillum sulfuroxidans]MBR9973700.1 glycosyltransferase family 4 protein [Magnetospirillum sulfuroxidans]